jgi:hypothetical protein
MSEHITHVAVYEDCTRIFKHSKEKFTRAFHESLEAAYDAGMFCSGSRGNHLLPFQFWKTTGKSTAHQNSDRKRKNRWPAP